MHAISLLSWVASLSKTMFRTCLLPLVFLFCFFQHSILENPLWDYQRNGPDTWPHTHDTCEGDAQSPINIRLAKVEYDPHLHPLSLNGYSSNDSAYLWRFSHNGHTIVAHPPALARLSISGADLLEEYYLDQIHLHWGYNIYQGSEHTINGIKYPLEMHFVHQSRYSRTLAVLSLLFRIRLEENPSLDELLAIVNETIDSSITVERQMNISRLFPGVSPLRFYRYDGSLTTPPCTEGVRWIISARFIPIAPSQWKVFVRNSVPMNFRLTQKLQSRTVTSNFEPESDEDASSSEEDHRSQHSSVCSHSIPTVLLVFILFCHNFCFFPPIEI